LQPAAMGATACCCKESNMDIAKRPRGSKELTMQSKSMQDLGVAAGQARAHLSVKTGGFSLGAFAASNRGKLEDYYRVEKMLLGEGSYGSVQKCENIDTGQLRAVKTITKNLVKNPEQFREEMAIMKLLDHPNIVRLYETFEDQRNVYLILELCTGGELFDRIVADGKFTEQAAASCIQQMLRAINYMHQNYIMHRDLKPENWLLASAEVKTEKMDLKLIDFGLSKRFASGEYASTKAGTPYYVAPEVLEGRYGEQSDVWSIGVIMYILLCGSPPFTGNDTVAVLDSVKRAKPPFDKKEWKRVSSEAKQLLKGLLTRNPATRMNAADALRSPWITMALQGMVGDDAVLTGNVVSNLKSFAAMNKLKKASLNVIASQLNDIAIKELKELFIAMDDNNDGTLSVGELKEGLKRAGVAIPPDLADMMDSIDTDGSGVLDYSEFVAATLDKRKYIQEDMCWRAFKTFDVDGGGTIDKEELLKLLGFDSLADQMQVKLTEAEVDAIMNEVDLNRDGKIDFEEFMAMMRKMPNARTEKIRRNIGLGKKL